MRGKIKIMAVYIVALLLLITPLVNAEIFKNQGYGYEIYKFSQGVLAKDRTDGGGAHDYAFQGPGPITPKSNSTGHMRDIIIYLTNYTTIYNMTYASWFNTPKGLDIFDWDLPLTIANPPPPPMPLEGWVIFYNLTAYPYKDNGTLIVTYSGFPNVSWGKGIGSKLNIGVFGDSNDQWLFLAGTPSTNILVDNPRLKAINTTIIVVNNASMFKPTFKLEQIFVFNKATKFVERFMRLKLIDISYSACYPPVLNISFSKMAIFDANKYCDKSFWGWKNVTIRDPDFFLVLAWTNESILGENRDYYATYMLAHPIPDSFAIVSTLREDRSDYVDDVWGAGSLKLSKDIYGVDLNKRVELDMSGKLPANPPGDQALVRVEWIKGVQGSTKEEILKNGDLGWKLVQYGVYDVNATYDGGEGGIFKVGNLKLSNGTLYTKDNVTIPWDHTGTLGYLNKWNPNIIHEDQLCKTVAVDLNKNGTIDKDETFDTCWYPTEELVWQLKWKFAPPKIPPPSCCFDETYSNVSDGQGTVRKLDFIVIPAPGATTDAAGVAWLMARWRAQLVAFDVEPRGLKATIGYTNPGDKVAPYFMLEFEAIGTSEDYKDRKAHYLTSDGRALPQIGSGTSGLVNWTEWNNMHYFVVTVAGVHPNLATYYFNDFSPIVRAIGGDYQWSIVVVPRAIVYPSAGPGSGKGWGVISMVRDHFNNTALIVYGWDAQDTYWTAYYAAFNMTHIIYDEMADGSAALIRLDYPTPSTDGIVYPLQPKAVTLAVANEYNATILVPP